MNIFLNSYYPISSSWYGRNASSKFGIHPLEDGSIRREPDLMHPYPSISGLCRPGSMNQIRLAPGDIIIYKTNHKHILSAILQVLLRFEDHHSAAEWFREKKLSVPTNNISVNSLSINYSHAREFLNKVGRSNKSDHILTQNWDSEYQIRSKNSKSSYFFITEPIYNAVSSNLHPTNYINIANKLRQHYGSVPNTAWRPQLISQECYKDIMNLMP